MRSESGGVANQRIAVLNETSWRMSSFRHIQRLPVARLGVALAMYVVMLSLLTIRLVSAYDGAAIAVALSAMCAFLARRALSGEGRGGADDLGPARVADGVAGENEPIEAERQRRPVAFAVAALGTARAQRPFAADALQGADLRLVAGWDALEERGGHACHVRRARKEGCRAGEVGQLWRRDRHIKLGMSAVPCLDCSRFEEGLEEFHEFRFGSSEERGAVIDRQVRELTSFSGGHSPTGSESHFEYADIRSRLSHYLCKGAPGNTCTNNSHPQSVLRTSCRDALT